ncbi:hypothetical protein KI387_019354, partial [Taxus chinensis]
LHRRDITAKQHQKNSKTTAENSKKRYPAEALPIRVVEFFFLLTVTHPDGVFAGSEAGKNLHIRKLKTNSCKSAEKQLVYSDQTAAARQR